MSSASPNNNGSFQRGWIGFGRNYFHSLGSDLYTEIPEEAYDHDDAAIYSWGIASDEPAGNEQEEEEDEDDDDKSHELEQQHQIIKAYQYTRELPAKPKKRPEGQIAPAACTSAATLFLSGERHNRIITVGTIHGRVMNPELEKTPTQASSSSSSQKTWSPSPSTLTIPLPLPCVELAAGRHFCLARLEGGLAVCSWGAGHFGQLGHGASFGPDADGNNTSTYQATPKVIERLLPRMVGSPIVQIAAGDWHGTALSAQGVVLSWGCNRNLQCGRKPASKNKTSAAPLQMIPMPVTILDHEVDHPNTPIHITKVACGKAHSVAISRDKRAFCWGASHYGQCAANPGGYRTSKYTRNTTTLPRAVEALKDVAIVDVAAGDRHTLALSQGGRLFSWGAGAEGQLGIFPPVVCTPKPRLVQDLDFVAIAAGDFNRQQQKLSPAEAAAANAGTDDSSNKTRAQALASVPTITSVEASGCSSYAISSSGHVYAWGSNDAGTLALPIPDKSKLPYYEVGVTPSQPTNASRLVQVRTFDSEHNVLLPRRVDALSNVSVQHIMCGTGHIWCLAEARSTDEARNLPVGRTLHEVHHMRSRQGDGNPGLDMKLSGSMSALSSVSEHSATSPTSRGAPADDSNAREFVSHSSTLPTDEEDDATEVGLASSIASLSYSPDIATPEDGMTPHPTYPNSTQAGGRRHTRRHSEPGNGGKSRNFSLRNLLSKIGSSRRGMNSSTTGIRTRMDEEVSNHDSISGHDKKSGENGNSDQGKGGSKKLFRRNGK